MLNQRPAIYRRRIVKRIGLNGMQRSDAKVSHLNEINMIVIIEDSSIQMIRIFWNQHCFERFKLDIFEFCDVGDLYDDTLRSAKILHSNHIDELHQFMTPTI